METKQAKTYTMFGQLPLEQAVQHLNHEINRYSSHVRTSKNLEEAQMWNERISSEFDKFYVVFRGTENPVETAAERDRLKEQIDFKDKEIVSLKDNYQLLDEYFEEQKLNLKSLKEEKEILKMGNDNLKSILEERENSIRSLKEENERLNNDFKLSGDLLDNSNLLFGEAIKQRDSLKEELEELRKTRIKEVEFWQSAHRSLAIISKELSQRYDSLKHLNSELVEKISNHINKRSSPVEFEERQRENELKEFLSKANQQKEP